MPSSATLSSKAEALLSHLTVCVALDRGPVPSPGLWLSVPSGSRCPHCCLQLPHLVHKLTPTTPTKCFFAHSPFLRVKGG